MYPNRTRNHSQVEEVEESQVLLVSMSAVHNIEAVAVKLVVVFLAAF